MIAHIVMEKVDLGGIPICGHFDLQAAERDVEARNAAYNLEKRSNLITGCGYSLEQANAYAAFSAEQFYIESIEVS